MNRFAAVALALVLAACAGEGTGHLAGPAAIGNAAPPAGPPTAPQLADKKISRIERSRRFLLSLEERSALSDGQRPAFLSLVHDRMTECPYPAPLATFETGTKPEPVRIIPLLEEGRAALEKINREMGLGLDDWDLDYYTNLFVREIKRNPTNVECFDLSQSNSEHSRHWFFRGRLIVDGKEIPETLMKIVKATWEANKNNSVIAFSDNSSAIIGYDITTIIPETPGKPSPFRETKRKYHIILTAETHNFPSGVAPFPGAETGTGGRIRDVQATGTGGLVVAGTAFGSNSGRKDRRQVMQHL